MTKEKREIHPVKEQIINIIEYKQIMKLSFSGLNKQ